MNAQKSGSIILTKKTDQYSINPGKVEIEDQDILARMTLMQVMSPLPPELASSELL